jgi:ATP:cob(I)alamin adenosyltransferase
VSRNVGWKYERLLRCWRLHESLRSATALSVAVGVGERIASGKVLVRTVILEPHAAVETSKLSTPVTFPPALQGGGLASAHLHLARTVARRAERVAVGLVRFGSLPVGVQVYLNRLSDYLFVAARFAAMRGGAVEAVYKKARGVTERALAQPAGAEL